MHIAGKVALITGGVGGLGKAFATALLNAQASAVCLVDISNNGKQISSELGKKFPLNQKVEFYHCDVTDYTLFKVLKWAYNSASDWTGVDRLANKERDKDVALEAPKGAFDFVEKRFGGVDIVCNNAGISAIDADVERSIQTMRINLEAVFFGTKLAQEYMDKDKGRGGGVVINIGSMAAFLPIANAMAYSASKSGVVQLSRTAGLPETFEMYGVRVNCLCPSFTETDIIDSVPGTREAIAQIPGHYILDPDFVAQGFLQLIEDDSLNGAVMRVTPQKGIDFYGKKTRSFVSTQSKL